MTVEEFLRTVEPFGKHPKRIVSDAQGPGDVPEEITYARLEDEAQRIEEDQPGHDFAPPEVDGDTIRVGPLW